MEGGPASDLIGYWETVLEYYLSGVDHRKMTNKQFAQKVAHLQYIREQEAKTNPFGMK